MSLLFKLLHVLAAIWFIAGLLGRNIVLAQARKASDLQIVEPLMQLEARFDNLLVIPGSIAVLVLGLLTAWSEGYPIFGLLQGAKTNWLFISLILFLTIVPLVPLVFLPRGRLFENAMKEAVTQNRITPQLELALSDKVVGAAHIYELVVITIVVILMVTKPF
jgi:uncharacterized membrane protein